MKLRFSGQIFVKCSNIKFHENLSSRSRIVHADRQLEKLITTLRNFANAPTMISLCASFTGLYSSFGLQESYSRSMVKLFESLCHNYYTSEISANNGLAGLFFKGKGEGRD